MAESDSLDAVRHSLGLRGILAATVAAALVALVLLVTVVAPAEYGYDPTGIGHRIGLDRLYNNVPTAGVLWRAEGPRRQDSAQVQIAPGDGIEIKAVMLEGQQLVYSWQADGGALFVEAHGDPSDGSEYSSYATTESATQGEGGLTAPFEGEHGWYWRNDTTADVTVTLDILGYYQLLKTK